MSVLGFRRVSAVFALLLLAVTITACSSDDDEGDPPTATPAPPTATVAPTVAPSALTEANSSLISDGVCEARVPDGWVDDGTGQGSTIGGHPFTLFGGRVRSDAEWDTSVNLVATPQSGYTVFSTEVTDDSVYVVYGGDRGFEYRKRSGDRYCDFRVTSRSGAIAQEERAYWDAVTQSLAPVQQ